ncbi:MAG: pilin [Patescibacteria group bacterium]|nr:pilin [Patescibacteria group bacterium]
MKKFGKNLAVCTGISSSSSVGDVINLITCILLKSVIPLLFALATVAFVWGIIQYFLNPGNEEKRKEGKQYLIWGLVGLFVMVSIWGLVGIIAGTFGLDTVFIPQLSQ